MSNLRGNAMEGLSDRRVLVTGSDGFIGSHVVEELACRRARVRAFVQYNSLGSWGWLDELSEEIRRSVDVVAGDVRDAVCVREAMRGCDAVIHLAALVAIPFSYVAPENYLDTNVKGTLNVVQAARDLGVTRLVHTSTSEVYGSARFVPVTEDHPVLGQSPYSASKIAADQIAYAFYASFGTPVVTIRPFNTYGPRQSARAVIPTIITQLVAGERRIKLGALHPTRDFTYVTDTAKGLIAGLTAAADLVLGHTINLGSNFEISIGDTAAVIAELVGREIEIEEEAVRLRPAKSEVDRLWADNSRARELLGWTPEFGGRDGFARGLARTIDWFREPSNLTRYRVGRHTL
jgi:NAD dependent epimerase/dehydratase